MTQKPHVGIIMGSDSDLSIMQEVAKVLDEFEISHEVMIVSAHRTPDRLVEYAKSAESRELKVIVAGAGGSAHLPGMTAAMTMLPVIGVPIETKTTRGIDSLFSIVQMPPGIPVATVGINGAKNAGILAAQIIGTGDPEVRAKVKAYKEKMAKDIVAKDAELQEKGFKKYLEEKGLV